MPCAGPMSLTPMGMLAQYFSGMATNKSSNKDVPSSKAATRVIKKLGWDVLCLTIICMRFRRVSNVLSMSFVL